MRESTVLQMVRIAASKIGIVAFRNNVGIATAPDGSVIRYGVCNPGGSDLIGWRKHLITERDVGNYVAVFVAIETKSARGVVSKDQTNFLEQVEDAGGIAIVARCEEDVAKGVSQWTNMTT